MNGQIAVAMTSSHLIPVDIILPTCCGMEWFTKMCICTQRSCNTHPFSFVLCRRTDKQPLDLPNQEGEEEDVQELAMDDVLMLDQEPEPDFDLDDAQRPRLSRVKFQSL